MASIAYKILAVLVVALVATASIAYFYSNLPAGTNTQFPIKSVSMVSPEQVNATIGGNWQVKFSGEGGGFVSLYASDLLKSITAFNVTFGNASVNSSNAESYLFSTSDTGITAFSENSTGSALIGAYSYFENSTSESSVYHNASAIAKGNLSGYVNGTLAEGIYFSGYYTQVINGTAYLIFVAAGLHGNYAVTFTFIGQNGKFKVNASGMVNLLSQEFKILPSDSIVYPPDLVTINSIESISGMTMDSYAFMEVNFTNFGNIVQNLSRDANSTFSGILGNVSGYNLTQYIGEIPTSFLNNVNSIGIAGGINDSMGEVVAAGSVGTVNRVTASLIWSGLPYMVQHNSSIADNFTVHSLNSTMYSVAYKGLNGTDFTLALYGNFVIFVLSGSYGGNHLSVNQVESLITAEENTL